MSIPGKNTGEGGGEKTTIVALKESHRLGGYVLSRYDTWDGMCGVVLDGVPGDPPPAHLTNYHNIIEGVPATPIRETGRLG